jgi:hypothetical protein
MSESDCAEAIARLCPALDEAVASYFASMLADALSVRADPDNVRDALADAFVDHDVAENDDEAWQLCKRLASALNLEGSRPKSRSDRATGLCCFLGV